MTAILLLIAGNAFAQVAVAEDRIVALDAKEVKPLKVGDALPAAVLKDANGKDVKLSDLHVDGPLVIVFFRGSWCPFCTRHIHDLIKVYPEITKLGAKLVAISPDNVEHSQANVAKNAIPFSVLSDSDVTLAKALGLAFQVDDATITKYKGYGIDLNKASGQDHHVLPVPAVFIADKSGKLIFAHSDPDYRQRLEVKTILEELQKAPK
jgi:peroxiredoxin